MKKTTFVLSLAALALLGTGSVFAYQGDPAKQGPNCTPERHQKIETYLQKGDYTAWSKEMAGRGVTRFVNSSNFKEFSAAKLAAEKGDLTKWNAFRAKYWTQGQGRGQGMGQGRGYGLNR